MSEVTAQNVSYSPGDKWSCGRLEFEAETPFGLLTYAEVIPGPRYSEDSRELTLTLDGVDLDPLFDRPDVFCPPSFEAPGKPGRWADEFEAGVDDEVQSTVEAWFAAFKGLLWDFLAERKAVDAQPSK